jgi:hypothetical protein
MEMTAIGLKNCSLSQTNTRCTFVAANKPIAFPSVSFSKTAMVGDLISICCERIVLRKLNIVTCSNVASVGFLMKRPKSFPVVVPTSRPELSTSATPLRRCRSISRKASMTAASLLTDVTGREPMRSSPIVLSVSSLSSVSYTRHNTYQHKVKFVSDISIFRLHSIEVEDEKNERRNCSKNRKRR